MLKKLLNKTVSVVLIILLNYLAFFALDLKPAFAYFDDQEIIMDNTMSAGTLDLSTNSIADFSPQVTPSQTATRAIDIQNNGSLLLQTNVTGTNFDGDLDLCANLNLKIMAGATTIYNGSLIGLFSTAILIPTSTIQTLNFTAALTNNDLSLQNKTCNFDLTVNGWQDNIVSYGTGGFSDQEIINSIITTGSFQEPPQVEKCVKINEVYYDPDTDHGSSNDEWIEIYNACSYQVNLKNWVLKDNSSSTEPINANHLLDSGQFAALSSNASTWAYWPLIPSNAIKIALGGTQLFNGLNNDSDRVFLYDNLSNEIDAVSWGQDISAFDPAVLDVDKGHSIARKTKGVDTDTADDWEDLLAPNPGTNPHSAFTATNNFIEQITGIIEEKPEAPSITEETNNPEPLTTPENVDSDDLFLSPENPAPVLSPEEQTTQENSPAEEPPAKESDPNPTTENALPDASISEPEATPSDQPAESQQAIEPAPINVEPTDNQNNNSDPDSDPSDNNQ